MFYIALILGIYSYIIFFLGLAGLLYKDFLVVITFTYFGISLYILRDKIKNIYCYSNFAKKRLLSYLKKNITIFFILSLVCTQAVINLVGALGPELAFDALWYHLTLPKIYLTHNKIFFIPGGLLYYSAMPKLTEMYYISSLALQGEILAKIVHFTFGVLSSIALFMFSKKYFSTSISLIVTLVFYSNLVVSWESITAYIDLARTFYEIMALWAFLIWLKTNKKNWLIMVGIMVGLAIAAKLLAIGTVLIFSLLIIFQGISLRSYVITLSNLLLFWVSTFVVASPWFIFSLAATGNPVYPVFGGYSLDISYNILYPIQFIQDILGILLYAQDPISPIYLIALPLAVFCIKKFRPDLREIAVYSLMALIIWYFTPRTGGGRFILPYLPAFSILIGEVIRLTADIKVLKYPVLSCIILISLMSIAYRGSANSKYIPVLLNIQDKDTFLARNLNFSYGDFYDIDGYFKNNIKPQDKVLLYGFHNLYYVNFPYIDSSWIDKADKFNYIAVQNTRLPDRFKDWDLIYKNIRTKVSVYTNNKRFYYYR